jgi:hypothetical protein
MAEVDDVVDGAVEDLQAVVDAHHDDAPLEQKKRNFLYQNNDEK